MALPTQSGRLRYFPETARYGSVRGVCAVVKHIPAKNKHIAADANLIKGSENR